MYQRMAGVEALIRWRHPEQGVVYPKEFIPIAEQNRLITEIGRWVLNTACVQMASWDSSGLGELTLSVNVSHKQLEQPGFLAMVETVLDKTGLDPRRLMFEITESSLMNRKQVALASLIALHGMGIGISIDDFGTGYSSLDSLKRMHVNELKIDRSFIHNIGENEDNAEIVRTIISMAENLHLEVAAEGVEKADQIEFLAANGCGLVQGYYFGKPMVPRELATLAQRGFFSQVPVQGLTG
jgi:EAL domain-containing protein (putative c-di-GMP-specific phosphodiesterase class I)